MGDVSCFGNEVKLRDCRFDPDTSDHTYLQNAGVRCFPHGKQPIKPLNMLQHKMISNALFFVQFFLKVEDTLLTCVYNTMHNTF